MENKLNKQTGRLSKLLNKSPNFDCNDAFLNLTKYPNGDFCLRIKDHDSIEKTMAETFVFIQLMDLKKNHPKILGLTSRKINIVLSVICC